MFIDLDARPMIGERTFFHSQTLSKKIASEASCTSDETCVARDLLSADTRWEKNLARLRQRVQETQVLLGEDMREIEEPLRTLICTQENPTQEQISQVTAARTRYKQAMQDCLEALDRILAPFSSAEYLPAREDISPPAQLL